MGLLKYLIILLLFSFSNLHCKDNDMFLYTELYGPQESLISANFEVNILSMDNTLFKYGDLRLRGAVRITGLSFFTIYPSFLGGVHYVAGDGHKLDLGVNVLYQVLQEEYVMNTGTSISRRWSARMTIPPWRRSFTGDTNGSLRKTRTCPSSWS